MHPIRFSVVIPTRERADTLRHALRTCLDQTFDDYEVIVSDNCGSPATRAVVDEIGSDKVRYLRTSEPVAMSTNWEFAVSHARGDYVIVIGDDDGLLPHGLAELDRLTREHDAPAVRWHAAFYTWPTIALAGQGDYLQVPLDRRLYTRDGAATIREVAAFRTFYSELPMVYHGAVRRDVLDALRVRVGSVFPHPLPDVYSGFAVAHLVNRYLVTTVPMSVSGQSRESNGVATLFRGEQQEVTREFRHLNVKDGLRAEPTVPDLSVFPEVPVADAFAFAQRTLFPDAKVQLDRRVLSRACLSAVRAEDLSAAKREVRRSLSDDSDLVAWFDGELADAPHAPRPPVNYFRPTRLGVEGGALHLDAAAFDVSDVAGAARLCARLLNLCGGDVQYTQNAQAGTVTPIAEARDAENHRNVLLAACADREKTIHRLAAQLAELDRRLVRERRWSLKLPLRFARRLVRWVDRRLGQFGRLAAGSARPKV
ncbi:Glycosyltransferase involved in cell wall biogenesis OS=Methylocystis sp. (strain SC2) GN=BN69_1219 PE=4 SV=1: Glycos_transf_2 [Gemmataceae bacterium]|nr:Glycosyltransferase involved in cell wall biogenesis OS=Methylocystis sp. (strain SC2) GN=BN69_1219 PE=4 SV=1: Glycos_transf_2 [Gemmataceae bacterium]VTT96638.1 Glycosyltransferase involved in cell wall biogenesis OS=Methylocystis sp. (strain SC2) GN=BN69_1219 PE=4 SV=1: Glycos_transf_2 [Gemmataceae bacterium]